MATSNLISSKYGDFCVCFPKKKNPFVQFALGIFLAQMCQNISSTKKKKKKKPLRRICTRASVLALEFMQIKVKEIKCDVWFCIQLDKWSTASVTENRPHHHHAHISIYLSICVLLNWIPFAQDKSSFRFSCCVGDQHEGSNWLPHHSLFQTHETMCSGSRQVTNIRCQTQEKIITRRRRLLDLR